MNRTTRRTVAGVAVAALLAFAVGWLTGRGGAERRTGAPGAAAGPEVLYDAPSFALQTQRGDTLRSTDLRGTPWVLHVFFTHCRSVCPVTTGRMAALRDTLSRRGLLGSEVRLVSITVDPARDSLAAIRSWAGRHGADDPARWAFLRGEPPDRVRRLVQEGFKLSAMMPGDTAGDYQVTHSPRVLLVDASGGVRGSYEILRDRDFRSLLEELGRLAG